MFFIFFLSERVKLIYYYGKNDRKGLDMNENINKLLETIVSRSDYIDSWWRANPSKDCLSEDDEELLTTQLSELGNEIEELEIKINKVRDLIG